MSIVIACDSFLSLRNVRNGDLGRRLWEATGEEVIVLADPAQIEGAREVCPSGVRLEPLLSFSHEEDAEVRRLVELSYWTRKSTYDPRTLWSLLRASSYRSHRRWGPKRVASLAMARVRMARYGLDGVRGLAPARRAAAADALRRHPTAAAYRRLLEQWDAQQVVGFSLEGPREMVLLEAANAMGLPTAVMIRSRDNLAAKIKHLPDAGAYLVWSDWIRDFLSHMYPEISRARIHVTGSPQFDRHLEPRFRPSREDYFTLIGLDPERPLAVYTCATPDLIAHEIEIVQHLADAIGENLVHRRGVPAQLLVRGHPRGFGSNHALLRNLRPGVAVYPVPGLAAYRSLEHENEVVRLILEDEPAHLATLAYQDVQVNVSGTMTVDSAILDKPIVNVCYDLPANVPKGLSVRRFYERSDYRPIVASGGVRLATSPEECIRLINEYLETPASDADGRRWIRDNDCGPLDGGAGDRIAARLAALTPGVAATTASPSE